MSVGISAASDGSSVNLQIGGTDKLKVYQDGSVYYAGMQGWRNRIINGDMRIDQRNAGASVAGGGFPVDRWQVSTVSGGTCTAQRMSEAPDGFKYSIKYTVTASTTANDYNYMYQRIEAVNALDLSWGTATGKAATLSFWIKSSVAGKHTCGIWFYGPTSSYFTATYTISAVDTWQYITIAVPAPSSSLGAFNAAETAQYALITPCMLWSSGYTTTGAGGWTSSPQRVADAVTLASTVNATVQFTGVQFEKGTIATPFEYIDYSEQLRRCQRYFQLCGETIAIGVDTNRAVFNWHPAVTMRVRPTLDIVCTGIFSAGAPYYESTPWATVGTLTGAAAINSHMTKNGGDVAITGTFSNLTVNKAVSIFTNYVPGDGVGNLSYLSFSAEL